MSQYNKEFQLEDSRAEYTLKVVKDNIESELLSSDIRRKNILAERQYYMDYVHELKEDEKKNLLANERLETQAYESILNKLSRLAKQSKEPYFARFDFQEEGEAEPESFYLSIHTLKDKDGYTILTYDWRAPVSSLYYEAEPGNASFTAPDGEIKGILSLKRRFSFKNGKLNKFSDILMPSDDELLAEVLNTHADSHMKTIVQSIQKEQHKIIRDFIEGVSVIQGCAGSGKSSIALHKVAYILYGFRSRLKEQQMAIISPNDIFAEYISTVLPDLGEENLKQMVVEDPINECLMLHDAGGYSYLDRCEMQEFLLTETNREVSERLRKICEFKSGMIFRDTLKAYLEYLRYNIFVADDLYIDPDLMIFVPRDYLKELFYDVFFEEPLFKRISLISEQVWEKYKIRDRETRDYIVSALNEMLISSDVIKLYSGMYSDTGFTSTLDFNISRYVNPYFNSWEDASAVSVLFYQLNGDEFDGSMFYLIADEAQDFPPVYLELLQTRFKGCNMLFVGDKDQVVFENTGNYVNDIKKIISKNPFRRYTLNTNYRSTKEIVSFASKYLGVEADSINCVRNGSEPEFIAFKDIDRIVDDLYSQGFESIGILTKTRSEIKNLNLSESTKRKARICPVYLAKGLEFDCVFVVREENYDMNDDHDKKVFYTPATRAMHKLYIVRG